jgi:hypothetical protein
MSKSRVIHLFCLPSLFLLLLSLLLAACDTSSIGPKAATPTFQEVDGTPKGPGSANLTATARITPIATVCPTFSTAPASTNGWKFYKDTRFPFQFAIPPGWKAGSFTDGSGDDYITAVLPIGSIFPFENSSGAPEKFEISVELTGSPFNPSSDPTLIAERTPITISGMKTILYDRTSPNCGEYDRIAVAKFGQHQFTFYTGIYAPGKAQQDISLFLGIVQSFKYTG